MIWISWSSHFSLYMNFDKSVVGHEHFYRLATDFHEHYISCRKAPANDFIWRNLFLLNEAQCSQAPENPETVTPLSWHQAVPSSNWCGLFYGVRSHHTQAETGAGSRAHPRRQIRSKVLVMAIRASREEPDMKSLCFEREAKKRKRRSREKNNSALS